jgi:hypothetical protein
MPNHDESSEDNEEEAIPIMAVDNFEGSNNTPNE